MDIAQLYLDHGHRDRVYLHPADGSLLGLNSVNDRLMIVAEAASRKNPTSKRFVINQAIPFKSEADNETFGKLFLRFQGFMQYTSVTGHLEQASFDVGILQRPVFRSKISGWDPKTGEALEKITVLEKFKDVYAIPHNPDLVKSLSQNFHRCSFIVKNGNRKWTVTEADFLKDFDAVVKHVQPKFRRTDGAIE